MKKLTKNSSITLVELPPTLFGKLDGDTGFDIYTKFMLPPRALPVLTGILMKEGYDNVRMISPLFHGEKGKLSTGNWERIMQSDVLGISLITRTFPQSMRLADIYIKNNPEGIVIFGGMGASYDIENCLKHGDVVVVGEGEKTIVELMDRLINNPEDLTNLSGIAYMKDGEVCMNEPRELLTEEELNQLPLPFFDKEIREKANVGAVESQRGCPFDCDFCIVTKTYGKTIRYRSNESVIKRLKNLGNGKMSKGIFFTGDNLAGNPKKAISMLEAISDSKIRQVPTTVQVSVSAANNDELLKSMKKAGIKNLCVGFESINDNSLKEINKPFRAKQNTEAAKKFRGYGFWVHAMMMIGNDSDTPKTLKNTVNWAKKYVDSLQLFIPVPFGGTRYHDRMVDEGRIITEYFNLYDGQHCIIKPKNFSPYKLQKSIFDGYRDFYSFKSTIQRLGKTRNKKKALGIFSYISLLGGLKNTLENPETLQYLKFLKTIS